MLYFRALKEIIKKISLYTFEIYKLLQRGVPPTSVAYFHLQYEFKLPFRDILAKKKQIITIPSRNVEEVIGALTGIAGH